MIMLSSLLTVGAVVLGYTDSGSMTAALICGLLLIAVICDKEENAIEQKRKKPARRQPNRLLKTKNISIQYSLIIAQLKRFVKSEVV